MKRNFKRTLAKVMAVALTVALAGTAAPEADAAKKAKLSAKSVTVVKGKSKKVTIKNVKAKQVKKLAVTTSNKKIATVKKKGKTAFNVTGKKAGNAKVTVKVTVKSIDFMGGYTWLQLNSMFFYIMFNSVYCTLFKYKKLRI